jgi:hypothetical protein
LDHNDLLGLVVVAGNGPASLDFDFREHDPLGGENPDFNPFGIGSSGKIADRPLGKIFPTMKGSHKKTPLSTASRKSVRAQGELLRTGKVLLAFNPVHFDALTV